MTYRHLASVSRRHSMMLTVHKVILLIRDHMNHLSTKASNRSRFLTGGLNFGHACMYYRGRSQIIITWNSPVLLGLLFSLDPSFPHPNPSRHVVLKPEYLSIPPLHVHT